tara:strand:+ start:219385 stop:220539 length:1155 start_codon:yes stop_codon:yes gene_type:complete
VTDGDPNLWRQYDVYQRYRLLAQVLEAAFPEGEVRLLDLGSGPDNLCGAFLPERFKVQLSDTVTHGRQDIVALVPGEPLPFEDRSYDCVLALDVLEHVPSDGRVALIKELGRVASHGVVVSHPVASAKVEAADAMVAEAHRTWLQLDSAFLLEHSDYGLPAGTQVSDVLGAQGFATLQIANGPLVDWLPLTVVDVLLLAQCGTGGAKDEFNRSVNALTKGLQSPGEHYRTVTVACRDARVLQPVQARLSSGQRSRTPDDDFAIAEAVSGALVQFGRGSWRHAADQLVAGKDEHIGKLEEIVHAQGDELSDLKTRMHANQVKAIAVASHDSEMQAAVLAKDEHIRKLELLCKTHAVELQSIVAAKDEVIRELRAKLGQGRPERLR